MSSRVKRFLRELGRDEGEINQEEIEAFCKHAGYLKVLRYRSFEEEYSSPRIKFIRYSPQRARLILESEFENTFPPTLIHYYFALRAYDIFLQTYSRPPGASDDQDNDLTIMISLVYNILNEPPANPEMVTNACSEMYAPFRDCTENSIRAGGGELHNIASLMGGLVAQEAIKLITKQYIPSDNTCIFDGITSSTNVWAL